MPSFDDTITYNHPSRDPEKILYLRPEAVTALTWLRHMNNIAEGYEVDANRAWTVRIEAKADADPVLAALIEVARPYVSADEPTLIEEWEIRRAVRDAHNRIIPLPVHVPVVQPDTCSHGVAYSAICDDCEI